LTTVEERMTRGLAVLGLLGLALGVAVPAATQTTPKWRMGVVRYKADTAFELAGYEKGFYKEQGLDFEPVEMPGDADLLRALAAGTFEAAHITPSGTMAAIEKGAGLKIVATFMPGLPHVFYARKDINGFAELAGKPVGVSGLGALPHVVAQGILENHKVDLSKIEWVQMGGDPDRARAMVAGQVAGTVVSIEFEQMLKAAGAKILAVGSEELPHWTRFTVITTDKVIKERPGDLVKALIAQAKGTRWAMNPRNKDEMVRLLAKYGKRDAKQVDWVYDWFLAHKQLNPNGELKAASLNWMQELNVKLGRQKKVLPPDQVATFEFQKRMLAEIGEQR
jgi:ABC-type nitrate/sulfonate/bicarbonate transport system substrate-binding protein